MRSDSQADDPGFFPTQLTFLTGFRYLKIGLDPDREQLNAKLDARVNAMFERGLVEEVRHILALAYQPSSKALESIGYRQVVEHLQGRSTFSEAIAHTQMATRQYAKDNAPGFAVNRMLRGSKDSGIR